jgi:hypothetical protein
MFSIPDITFVPLDLVAFEQRAELILKRGDAMMRLLGLDVFDDTGFLRTGDGEGAVTSLPPEGGTELLLHPLAGTGFHLSAPQPLITMFGDKGVVVEVRVGLIHAGDLG